VTKSISFFCIQTTEDSIVLWPEYRVSCYIKHLERYVQWKTCCHRALTCNFFAACRSPTSYHRNIGVIIHSSGVHHDEQARQNNLRHAFIGSSVQMTTDSVLFGWHKNSASVLYLRRMPRGSTTQAKVSFSAEHFCDTVPWRIETDAILRHDVVTHACCAYARDR